MSTLAQRTNALQPTAAEIGDVDAIMRRYAELEAKKRASYVNKLSTKVDKPEVVAPQRFNGTRDVINLTMTDLPETNAAEQGQEWPPTNGKPRKNARQIIIEVAREFDVTVHDILSIRRNSSIVHARHEAVWRIKNETMLSFPQMGKIMKRDHSSLVHAYHKMKELKARETA